MMKRSAGVVLAFALAMNGVVISAASLAQSQPTITAPEESVLAYCKNVGTAVADARFARQAQEINALSARLDEKVAALDAKKAELQAWVEKREALMKRADESVVAIFSQMRPDAAALQMAALDRDVAAAILSKLNPRTASTILNEIEPGTAAQLTTAMAGLAPRKKDGKPG
jgi:flagellar motility protein MotE (MotC chaperone)